MLLVLLRQLEMIEIPTEKKTLEFFLFKKGMTIILYSISYSRKE